LIGLKITDFNHKEHKDHKGLAKVNAVPDNPKKTFCAGFVPFVSFMVYIVANRFDRIEDNGF